MFPTGASDAITHCTPDLKRKQQSLGQVLSFSVSSLDTQALQVYCWERKSEMGSKTHIHVSPGASAHQAESGR